MEKQDNDHKSIREAQRLYMKEMRRKNPDIVLAYNKTYWLRKAEKAQYKDGGALG